MVVAQQTKLEGVLLIEPKVFHDDRGFFLESFSQMKYEPFIPGINLVQDNISSSQYGTLRGMHFQSIPGQDKLVQVVVGEIYDVVVDMRPHSPTFKCWQAFELSDKNKFQLFVPKGFAHGFCVVSPIAIVHYKVSNYYNAATEKGFRYNDPEIGIVWPVAHPILSPRDQVSPLFSEVL